MVMVGDRPSIVDPTAPPQENTAERAKPERKMHVSPEKMDLVS
jgi:hypothetical protein